MGWEGGDVVEAKDAYHALDKVPAQDVPDYARIHYMMGAGFLGLGDDAWTSAFRRDITDPPLRLGENVVFDVDDGKVVEVRRECSQR
jgi:hypothetical protein